LIPFLSSLTPVAIASAPVPWTAVNLYIECAGTIFIRGVWGLLSWRANSCVQRVGDEPYENQNGADNQAIDSEDLLVLAPEDGEA